MVSICDRPVCVFLSLGLRYPRFQSQTSCGEMFLRVDHCDGNLDANSATVMPRKSMAMVTFLMCFSPPSSLLWRFTFACHRGQFAIGWPGFAIRSLVEHQDQFYRFGVLAVNILSFYLLNGIFNASGDGLVLEIVGRISSAWCAISGMNNVDLVVWFYRVPFCVGDIGVLFCASLTCALPETWLTSALPETSLTCALPETWLTRALPETS